MTYTKRIVLFIVTGITLMLFCIQSASAQSINIDENRMNRDIKIMENILQEMFKTRWDARGSSGYAHSGGMFSFGRSHNPHGTHLPDYGVIFTIPGARPGFASLADTNGEDISFNFEYGNDENGEKVTEESITNKIIEFLQNYGSTIGQLSDNDKVMVIYNTNESDQFDFTTFRLSGKDENEEERRRKIPTISVVAIKSDLQAYRAGNISANEFRNRLEISTAGMNDQNQMDLKVMANILETTLRKTGEGSFGITGPVDYLMLDNFGALFFGNAFSVGGQFFSTITPSDIDSISVQPQKGSGAVSITTKNGKQRVYSREEILGKRKKQQEQRKKELTEHYQTFVSSLKESLVDYGRTLRSVGSDQYILVSVTLNSRFGRSEDAPERIDMQVQKSTLEAMERGDMDREEAIDQIQVREY